MALADILKRSEADQWCTKWGCTTCGATDFRQAVLNHLGVGSLAGDASKELLAELSRLPQTNDLGPVEFLLCWSLSCVEAQEAKSIAHGTWVETVLDRILAVRRDAAARRSSHAQRNDPAFVAQERARKAAERAEAHRLRLLAKEKRDAERRERGLL